MLVLVVFVMYVLMFMLQRLVSVFMFVMLGQVQPDADCHQRPGDHEGESNFFTKQQSQQCTEKGSN
jgi:hypothetical protein